MLALKEIYLVLFFFSFVDQINEILEILFFFSIRKILTLISRSISCGKMKFWKFWIRFLIIIFTIHGSKDR